MTLTHDQQAFLTLAARAAYGAELETGCPSSVTLAQAITETGWGRNAPRNNAFGIKAVPGAPYQELLTTEYIHGERISILQRFAVYDSLQQAFEAHGELLMHGAPYILAAQKYITDRDALAFLRAIATRYATAPNYAQTLEAVLAMAEVKEALSSVVPVAA